MEALNFKPLYLKKTFQFIKSVKPSRRQEQIYKIRQKSKFVTLIIPLN